MASEALERQATWPALDGDRSIESLVGIVERRHARSGLEEERCSSLAAAAVRRALESCGLEAGSLTEIVLATSTPDRLIPSTASRVQGLLKATNALAFDVNAACAGFLFALRVARDACLARPQSKIAVVGAEVLSPFLSPLSRSTSILFGDGAGAAIVGCTGDGPAIHSAEIGTSGEYNDLLMLPAGGSTMPGAMAKNPNDFTIRMNGPAVRDIASSLFERMLRESLKETPSDPERTWFVPHQANLRLIESVVDKLGLPRSRLLTNIRHYGNTSAASIPTVLDQEWRAGRFKPGDTVHLAAVGAGFSYGRATLLF